MPAIPEAPPALESMYQLHASQVARWAERLAGPGLDLEDIVQEVFAIAYESVHSFRGDSSLATWLFGITDKVVRHRRRKERWRRWLSGSADETAGHLASHGPDPLRVVESNQAAAAVYQVLDRLPERDRQVLILCELEELDAEAVGRLLGIRQANVRLRSHRARARFLRAYREFVTHGNRRRAP
ncbi:MAG: sigma-70 family RNA polymerase sigma factor [Deltaproteobacteria bacterium]|nr:sigma-70 family RNA polymerase sigma factor [Deltaproteobacteria bacterium]